jgi:hypothetical protein
VHDAQVDGPILRLSRDLVVAGSRSGQSYPDGGDGVAYVLLDVGDWFARRGGVMGIATHRREVLRSSNAVAVGASRWGGSVAGRRLM